MALRNLTFLGNPILRQKSRPIEDINETCRDFIKDMVETMYHNKGIGLAACQVGVPERIIVLDLNPEEEYGKGALAVINPVLLSAEGEEEGEEGCLSVPEIRDFVTRAEKVVVSGLDHNGEKIEIEATGLLAKAFQHEIDHVNGVLFIDHLGPLKRQLHLRKFRKIKKEMEKAGEV
jgi:peptide deformylase